MRGRLTTGLALLSAVCGAMAVSASATEPPRVVDVLVLTETAGFRHSSIDEGFTMLTALADADPLPGVDLRVTQVTDSTKAFTEAGLKDVEVVAWVSNTGDVLSAPEKAAYEAFTRRGGGYLGIHAASDGGNTWPWYRDLVGGTFLSHPAIAKAKIVVEDPTNASTAHLPKEWVRTDEWYNFRRNPRSYVCYRTEEAPGVNLETLLPAAAPDLPPPSVDPRPKNCGVHVLATLDETSYSDNADRMGDHPIAWCHDYDGGRSWYTALGHTEASFTEAMYVEHVLGGLKVATGMAPCKAAAGS